MAESPLINAHRYSFASLELSLITPDGDSEIFIDINELSYSDALEIAFIEGANQAPVGWTSGVYKPGDASISMAKSSFQKGIVEKIGNGWLGSNLRVVAKYNDEGEPLTVDTLVTRITGAEDSGAPGPDGLFVKIALKPIVIKRNGITPLKQHLQ
jgi:hypothetical protein